MRLVQLTSGAERRVALVEEPNLRLLSGLSSVYELANLAIERGSTLPALVSEHLSAETVPYDSVYSGNSNWRLLPPLDHPQEPARCHLTGTGLTHLGSAKNRNAMHDTKEHELTDSMRMFQWGVASGKPSAGTIGIAPEWFYKGNGPNLCAHGEPLLVPAYAEDGGEEAEMASCYIIGPNGEPYRVGMATGNEFSDHVFEKKNYLNLAGSKLRTCSLGPELVLDPEFDSVAGTVQLERNGSTFWSSEIHTGESAMCHSLANIEHHHFKFEINRQPGDVHVHFLGAYILSFGDGVRLEDGDVMEIQFEGFGRPLRNSVRVARSEDNRPIQVRSLL